MYQEINRIVESYRAADNTDYAILLNGEWGCGKTYYVEHSLREAVEANGGHLIYASLHGVKNYEQIAISLMLSNIANKCGLEAKDMREEYWLSKVIHVLRESKSIKAKLIQLTFSHWRCKAKNNAHKIDKDTTLIVIDDIERAVNDDIRKEVLGCLYEEYIRRGYHVLLIGDETKIDKESSYFECKEKYVRRTVDVSIWQSDLIFDFARSRCERISWLYQAIECKFKWFVTSKKIVNLRVIAMMMDAVVDVVSVFDASFSQKNAEFLFSVTAPIVHAMSRGLLGPDDVNDFACLTQLQSISYYYLDKDKCSKLDAKMQKACKFYDEYCCDSESNFSLVKSIFRYVLTGYLDRVSITNEVLEFFQQNTTPEGLALGQLCDYWTSEEDELLECVKSVWGYLHEGKYRFEDILTIYRYMWSIKDRQYLSKWPYECNLKDMFIEFIRKRSKFEVLPSVETLTFIRLHREDFPAKMDMESLYDELDAFYDNQKFILNKIRIDEFFEALKDKNRAEAEKLSKSVSGHWHLFAEIEKYGKVNDVIKLPVWGIDFLEYQARTHILRISNSADFEKDQIPAIRSIATYLEDYVKSGKDSVSKNARFSDLAKVLRQSIEHMEDYMRAQK